MFFISCYWRGRIQILSVFIVFEFRSARLIPRRPDSPGPPSCPASQSAPSPPEFAPRALKSNSFPSPDRAAAPPPRPPPPLRTPRRHPTHHARSRRLHPRSAAIRAPRRRRAPARGAHPTPGGAVAAASASLHGRRRLQ
jgi:hypothetical protein